MFNFQCIDKLICRFLIKKLGMLKLIGIFASNCKQSEKDQR